MPLIEILCLATGFTGAVTLFWLGHMAHSAFSRKPQLEAHFGPGLLERVAKEVGTARREVLLLADDVAGPAVLQALLDAKGRKVAVEAVLGPAGQPGPLQALVSPRPVSANVLLLDGRILLVATEPFGDDGGLIVAKDHPEFIHAFREQILAARSPVVQPAPEPRPVPVFVPGTAPAPAVVAPPQEAFSYSFNPPAAPVHPADELLASTTKAPPPPLEDDEEDEATPAAGSPTVTMAAAELFARLRREVAGSRTDTPAA